MKTVTRYLLKKGKDYWAGPDFKGEDNEWGRKILAHEFGSSAQAQLSLDDLHKRYPNGGITIVPQTSVI